MRRPPSAEVLQQHVAELTAQHWIDWYDGKAEVANLWDDGNRTIHVPPIRGQVSYIVALHEIGHHVDAWQGPLLDREMRAWQWAVCNSKVRLSTATRRSIRGRFASYLCLAADDRRYKLTDEHWSFYCSLLT